MPAAKDKKVKLLTKTTLMQHTCNSMLGVPLLNTCKNPICLNVYCTRTEWKHVSRETESYSEGRSCVNQEGERRMHFTKVVGNPGPEGVHKCVENRKPLDTVSPESFSSFWDEWGTGHRGPYRQHEKWQLSGKYPKKTSFKFNLSQWGIYLLSYYFTHKLWTLH